ncbi:hypothetical protein, partial [Mycobacterium tuberculosis]|uniref:hypothetical protein n=1 Tax=Mycobacterium tuberculosis TaxID=1773 RepID=UPI00254B55EC
MSYQKFKVSVANAVITAENASLKTMNTDQLLDLFTPAPNTNKGLSKGSNDDPDEDSSIGVKGKGASILKGLGE